MQEQDRREVMIALKKAVVSYGPAERVVYGGLLLVFAVSAAGFFINLPWNIFVWKFLNLTAITVLLFMTIVSLDALKIALKENAKARLESSRR